MATTSSLPPQPAAASSAALELAIAETNAEGAKTAASGDAGEGSSASANANDAGDVSEANADQSADADDSIRTVFTDPENFNVKHPLYHKWTLWFDNPSAKGMSKASGGKDSWGEEMNKVVDFDSVEEFWGLYNNVIPPSALPQKANYYLFKDGIQPAWEDPMNANGGKWSIQLPRDKSRAGIDKLWLFTMLAAIGETLDAAQPGDGPTDEPELVTGVIMSARPAFYRLAIWTRRAEDPVEESAPGSVGRRLLEIGRHLKTQILGFDLHQKVTGAYTTDVEFQSHKESEKKKGKKFVI